MTPHKMWPLVKKKFKLSDKHKKEFFDSCRQYKNQHGVWPEKAELQKVPGLDKKINFLVCIGKSKAIFYNSINKKSRKGDFNYVHPTKEQYLLTDSKGEVLIYRGKTKMKNDGWLHH
ncbi:hypothetical protein [Candidatus Uabimicrobium sp. HlEnr_7]|uniref:hypothetical protein n=1 Tax=Candidatus Uabimicrobium helgolandensis TaxID=3095367 RepID=UPI0035570F42